MFDSKYLVSKTMKIIPLIGLIVIAFSCTTRQEPLTENTDSLAHPDINKADQERAIAMPDCHPWCKDSLLSGGHFVRYIRTNGKIKIEWGNKSFTRVLSRNYDCNEAPSRIPGIEWTSPEYIGLDYGCGSPCWGTIILPLNPTDSVAEMMYDFDRDITRNLIVYLGSDDYNIVTVENWKTRQRQPIDTKFACEAAFMGYCIDSLKLNGNKLFIRWKKEDGGNADEWFTVGRF